MSSLIVQRQREKERRRLKERARVRAKVAERNEMRVSFNRVRNRMGQRERSDMVYRRYRTKLMKQLEDLDDIWVFNICIMMMLCTVY